MMKGLRLLIPCIAGVAGMSVLLYFAKGSLQTTTWLGVKPVEQNPQEGVETTAEVRSKNGSRLEALDHMIGRILEENGEGLETSVWVGGSAETAWYEWRSSIPRPAASAIKTAILLEYFTKHHADLDGQEAEIAKMCEDDRHPAIADLGPRERWQVRMALQGCTVRTLGEVMMGKIATPNYIYNAAANIILADLGGPEAATKALHARDRAFAGIIVCRYMMAAREPLDNNATAVSLAAVLRRLATRSVPGTDEKTIEAMRQAVLMQEDPVIGALYSKDGDLSTDPLTVVRSGWCQTSPEPIVFVVMTVQPNPGSFSREMASTRQRETTDYLMRRVLEAAWRERGQQGTEKEKRTRRLGQSWENWCQCAPCKGVDLQWVQLPPGNCRSSR